MINTASLLVPGRFEPALGGHTKSVCAAACCLPCALSPFSKHRNRLEFDPPARSKCPVAAWLEHVPCPQQHRAQIGFVSNLD
jgi:hypothetical protein